MAELYSQYGSGLQFTAGTITGSALGTSGLNPIVDRLNSISDSDNNIDMTGSISIDGNITMNAIIPVISGTNLNIFGGGLVATSTVSGASLDVWADNVYPKTLISGTDLLVYASGGNLGGTHYWSVPGIGFTTQSPDIDNITKSQTAGVITCSATATFMTEVNLPHNAIVTECTIYGSESDETWGFNRSDITAGGNGTSLASANVNTTDSSISNATIDNSAYRYWLFTSSFDNTDVLYGAVIKYTI